VCDGTVSTVIKGLRRGAAGAPSDSTERRGVALVALSPKGSVVGSLVEPVEVSVGCSVQAVIESSVSVAHLPVLPVACELAGVPRKVVSLFDSEGRVVVDSLLLRVEGWSSCE
jgi:hypothetical protein